MSSDAPKKNYRWTVMVYLAGDNNLTDECVYALTQMKEVEGLDEAGICVLAQFDPKGGRLSSHRYKISPASRNPAMSDDYQTWIDSPTKFKHDDYEDFAAKRRKRSQNRNKQRELETNTGSPVTLFNFVTWAVEEHAADNYMLVLSGHGGGTEKGYLLRDENPADSLTMWEMQVALDAIHDAHDNLVIDILGMDSCMMTMAEVSHQLKERARIMVGSEGYSPIAGWPFKPVLTKMREVLEQITDEDYERRREKERRAIADAIVKEYVNYYVDYSIGGLSVEQASLDLGKTTVLTTAIDNLAEVLSAQLERNDSQFTKDLVFAHWRAQSYNGERFVDIYDFCELLRDNCASEEVRIICQRVLDTENAFVTSSCYSGPTYQHSHGVSIYFPWAEIDPDYSDVRFGRTSKWVKFLEAYVVATRRKPRHEGGKYGDNSQPYATRHTEGKHGPGKVMLPEVLSMRNPPLSAGLSDCVREPDHKQGSLGKMSRTWSAA